MPSLQCHPEHGDAVLKDRCGATHYLLIPTARRTGVESPELLRDDEPDYFGDAWAARDRVIAASGRSDVRTDELGLAINSRRKFSMRSGSGGGRAPRARASRY